MNINKQQRTGSSTFMLIAGIACVGIAVITSLDLFTPAATGSIEPIESIATPQLITKKIEDIRPGDMVVSKDDVTGKVTRNKVVRLFRNTSDHLRILEFRHNDNDSATHRIETTNAHPFWVKDSGWVDATDLRPGDQVETSDSSLAVLVSTQLEHHTEGVPVFNFEVANAHSYYVQNPDARGPPIWVHNDCGFVPLEAVEQAAREAALNLPPQNSVPRRLARVVPAEFADTPTLGSPGTTEVFVTGGGTRDIGRITTSRGLARRLTLVDEGGELIGGARAVIEFDNPGLIASPINRTNPGFVGGGRTAGNAREFVIPNFEVSELNNVVIRIVE